MAGDLRQAIENFSIDGTDDVSLPFVARLARDHGWDRVYAERVVQEYRRFLYLAVTSGFPVCPSEEVDEAWHLHLTYTRSYWDRLCGQVLGQPLHHDPTRGGPAEADKHHRMYERTLAEYRRVFGSEPPRDIWPPTAVRFALPRPKRVPRRAVMASLGAAAVLFLTGCLGDFNPFGLVGIGYLVFLVPLMIASVGIGLLVRIRSKAEWTPDGPLPELDWQQVAYLEGGAPRLLSAGIAHLVKSGVASVSPDGAEITRAGELPADAGAVEKTIFQALPLRKDNTTDMVRTLGEVNNAFLPQSARFESDGLIFSKDAARRIASNSAYPLIGVLLVFGLPRLVMGLINERPSGYLVVALIVGALVALVMRATRPSRTRRATEALEAVKTRHAHLKNPTSETVVDPAMAIALFGTVALAGTSYAMLHQWYPRQMGPAGSTDTSYGGGCTSGDSGGGGDGGGGGCGSGCGGCGGGGD